MRSPRHTIFIVTITVAAVLAGCARARDAAEPPPSKLERAEVAFAKVADRRGVVLADVERPAPPRGYDANDVDQVVRDATDVLDRSVDPALSRVAPMPAVRQVLAKQYDKTTAHAIAELSDGLGSLAWVYASRAPSEARIKSWTLAARAEARVQTPRRGPKDPYLVVSVEAFFLHRVTIGRTTRPIVVRRVITIATYDPTGGPEYWPIISAAASAYGNDFCSLATGSVLRPSRDTAILAGDTTDLRRALGATVIRLPTGDAREFDQRARRCSD